MINAEKRNFYIRARIWYGYSVTKGFQFFRFEHSLHPSSHIVFIHSTPSCSFQFSLSDDIKNPESQKNPILHSLTTRHIDVISLHFSHIFRLDLPAIPFCLCPFLWWRCWRRYRNDDVCNLLLLSMKTNLNVFTLDWKGFEEVERGIEDDFLFMKFVDDRRFDGRHWSMRIISNELSWWHLEHIRWYLREIIQN